MERLWMARPLILTLHLDHTHSALTKPCISFYSFLTAVHLHHCIILKSLLHGTAQWNGYRVSTICAFHWFPSSFDSTAVLSATGHGVSREKRRLTGDPVRLAAWQHSALTAFMSPLWTKWMTKLTLLPCVVVLLLFWEQRQRFSGRCSAHRQPNEAVCFLTSIEVIKGRWCCSSYCRHSQLDGEQLKPVSRVN